MHRLACVKALTKWIKTARETLFLVCLLDPQWPAAGSFIMVLKPQVFAQRQQEHMMTLTLRSNQLCHDSRQQQHVAVGGCQVKQPYPS